MSDAAPWVNTDKDKSQITLLSLDPFDRLQILDRSDTNASGNGTESDGLTIRLPFAALPSDYRPSVLPARYLGLRATNFTINKMQPACSSLYEHNAERF